VKKCEVKKFKASPSSLPFKGVLHTVAPRWDYHAVKDNKTFEKQLKLTICNIVKHWVMVFNATFNNILVLPWRL
jgi:hypothetical protein